VIGHMPRKVLEAAREPAGWHLLDLGDRPVPQPGDYQRTEDGVLVPTRVITASYWDFEPKRNWVATVHVRANHLGGPDVIGYEVLPLEAWEARQAREDSPRALLAGPVPVSAPPGTAMSERQHKRLPLYDLASFAFAVETLVDEEPRYVLASSSREDQREAVRCGVPVVVAAPEPVFVQDGVTWWRWKPLRAFVAARADLAELRRGGARFRVQPPLDQVATIWRTNPRAGTKAVAERWGVSLAQARRYVQAAEDEGHLNRAQERKQQ
jgi:hypothetical protein